VKGIYDALEALAVDTVGLVLFCWLGWWARYYEKEIEP